MSIKEQEKVTVDDSDALDRMNSRLSQTPIAIVGMASVYANSSSLDQYWDNIVDSVDSIIDIPESRWKADDYYSEDKRAEDKTYCKRGGFVPELDFDPMEFGLPPNILELTDISQLLSLVVARDVLNDAGIGEDSGYDRDKVGIVLGVGGGQKQISPLTSRLQGPVLDKVLKASGVSEDDREVIIEKFKKAYIPWTENSFPGMLGNVIAGRIANRFDFGGTNCVVDAACAGSLAAMKLAIGDLLDYRSEVMISGGVCCDNSPFMYMSFSKTPAFTTDDQIRPFDQSSKGMMVGEGIGMIAFKRLEDAERDGDRIYAVVKGIGSSSDGRFKSIYAPRPLGQSKALTRAYEDAGVDPATVGLIEAHGTGTLAGDAAEFAGLNDVFSKASDEKQHIALGSVKSQVGHTKSAAGAAGIIKAALALHHKVLPPTINVDQPADSLDIENSPFYLNTETRPWFKRADGEPRRAGVSSFGFGGTNFHLVIEEYQATQNKPYRLHGISQSIVLSAPDKDALIALSQDWQKKLSQADDLSTYAFNTLIAESGISDKADVRLGFVAKDSKDALAQLEKAIQQLATDKTNWSLPSGVYFRASAIDSDTKTAALFSGQGSQYVNMGADLLTSMPEFLTNAENMDAQFVTKGLAPLSAINYPIPVFDNEALTKQEENLRQTQNAQPAIGQLSASLYQAFNDAGLQVDYSAGHSFGELTALWAAGVIDTDDFYQMSIARGQAMAAPDDENFDAGSMLAVISDAATVQSVIADIDGISIANFNAPKQIVVAGKTDQLLLAKKRFESAKIKAISLPVSAAFHTPLVAHAHKPFSEFLAGVTFKKPAFDVLSNTTGNAYSHNPDDIKAQLQDQLLQPVQFTQQIENLYAQGVRVFIEFGPKNVLAKLTGSILKDKEDLSIIAVNGNSKQSDTGELMKAYCQLQVLGFDLDAIDHMSKKPRPEAARKMSPMAMKLSAASFVSEKTQQAFTDALNDGFKIQQAQPEPAKVIEKIVEVEKIIEVEKIVEVERVTDSANASVNVKMPEASPRTVIAKSDVQQKLDGLLNYQQSLLQVHETFMQSPVEYMKTMDKVIDKAGGHIPEDLQNVLAQLHDYQTQTLKVHETFLHTHTRVPSSTVQVDVVANTQTVKPVVQAPIKTPAIQAAEPRIVVNRPVNTPHKPAAVAAQVKKPTVKVETASVQKRPVAAQPAVDIHKIMMAVVADKTGYPVDMLDSAMDMEADLGIDSIKRVEILGQIQDEVPNLPELNPEDLAELRTLGQIADYIDGKRSASEEAVSAPVASAASVIDVEAKVMAIVAEKTGYPVDMLDSTMDMEADLGIDSIKRVEILGEVQDQIDDLPELDPEVLAELRTLGQISEHIESKLPKSATVQQSPQASTISEADITASLLAIVAEKTGYPIDMLDVAMDMEADLGIDSIKRVEILGAMQEDSGNLSESDNEALSELRTLAQIIDWIGNQGSSHAAPETAVDNSAVVTQALDSDQDVAAILLAVVAEKTGYPETMIANDMDLEADLGVDSIKRVEILGAVQEQLDSAADINPEAMAEMRTLEQIANYLQPESTATITAEQVAPTSSNIDLNAMLLSVVAEKTGYPVEMLDLKMDMEADLGIDSIKRVEILGAVQDLSPDMPEADPEALSEMRTLGAIVDYFSATTSTSETSIAETETVTFNDEPTDAITSATVETKSLPAVNRLNTSLTSANILMVDDGSDCATELADFLIKQGASLTVLCPEWISSAQFSDSIKTVQLPTCEEKAVEKVIADCQSLQGIIYLNPRQDAEALSFPESSKMGLELAFLIAKHAKLQATENNRAFFISVSRMNGAFNLDEQTSTDNATDWMQGGIAGLLKTLDQEWPAVFCRALDFDDVMSQEQIANAIEDELFDADSSIVEVGYQKQRRLTPVAVQTDSFALTTSRAIAPENVFLVSGGAKGVTANCVIELAKSSSCHFILLGRSALKAEPEWTNGIDDLSQLKQNAIKVLKDKGKKPTPVSVDKLLKPILAGREITDTLSAIEQAGASADYVSADVTNVKALKKNLTPLTKKRGAITGIIHGAGVLADKYIEDKKFSDYQAVMSTKVDGLQALLGSVDCSQLKYLVLFSSAAGFYGNPGQSDYAMANEVLNKAASRFKSCYPEAQVLSFNWGPWDGGMVTPEIKKMFKQRGVQIIAPEKGARIMLNEMTAEDNRSVHIIVGNSMKQSAVLADLPKAVSLKKRFNAMNNPMLGDHVIGGNQVLPTVCAIAWMADAVESQYQGYRYQGINDYKLLKGIVVDSEESGVYDIDLTLVSNNGDTAEVEVVINSEGVRHYSARVQLIAKDKLSDTIKVPLQINDDKAEDAQALYTDGTLFHGESLQVVQQVLQLDKEGLLLRCKVPQIAEDKEGEFPLHQTNVFANDVAYQAMLIWVRKNFGMGSLPSAMASWTSYREIEVGEIFYLTLNVVKSSKSRLTANIQLIDSQDVLIADIEAAEVTISKSLNALFNSAA